MPAARRVPWTAPPHTSARVAGSAVPAAGQVHAHPRHLRREGRRDLRVGLARRAGPPRTSAHLDAPRHTSAHLGRASAHPRHTGGKQTPRNTSAESRQIWRSLGTHLCTSASPVAHRKAGCGSPMTRPRRVHPTPQAVKEVRTSPALKKVLQMTLALGNYLNGGTNKGAAWGFKLDTLSKLSGTKTVDNKSTLLHYIAGPLASAGWHISFYASTCLCPLQACSQRRRRRATPPAATARRRRPTRCSSSSRCPRSSRLCAWCGSTRAQTCRRCAARSSRWRTR